MLAVSCEGFNCKVLKTMEYILCRQTLHNESNTDRNIDGVDSEEESQRKQLSSSTHYWFFSLYQMCTVSAGMHTNCTRRSLLLLLKEFTSVGMESQDWLKRDLSSEFLVHSFTKIKNKIDHGVTGNIRKGAESLISHLPEENWEKYPHY